MNTEAAFPVSESCPARPDHHWSLHGNAPILPSPVIVIVRANGRQACGCPERSQLEQPDRVQLTEQLDLQLEQQALQFERAPVQQFQRQVKQFERSVEQLAFEFIEKRSKQFQHRLQ
ncbi:MAG: hypothetical protein M3Q50_15460 [Chloroflexota bacterium]|nr:hypothetical protein [Chloroflexota bacterium]